MSPWRLVWRSGWYYRWTQLGVVAAAAIGTAVIVGALLVGDSVSGTLMADAEARIGSVHLAMASGTRFIRAAFASELSATLETPATAVIMVRGVARKPDGSALANDVQILGVADDYWKLGPVPDFAMTLADDQVLLNRRLADQLHVAPGDTVVLRLDKPSMTPRDVPLATDAADSIALRLTVHSILSVDEFGRFSLYANQIAPYNAFVSHATLARRLGLEGKANLVLLGEVAPQTKPDAALRKHPRLADVQLALNELPSGGGGLELRSERVFITDSVRDVALSVGRGARPILTYFVNEMRAGNVATPYSMVTAMTAPVTRGLENDQILISQWLADDLDLGPGDPLDLTYYTLDTGRALVEKTSGFTVAGVLPMDHPALDRLLMPDYPGLADADHCRDWEAGIPMDMNRIRDKDEDYWTRYRGTPKALINYQAGAALWGNRFGQVTAVRYAPDSANELPTATALLTELDPAKVGLRLIDIRSPALAAARQALDFGGLFIGMSFFLIVAAVVLTGLLFGFGVEQRRAQTGTLLALGLPAKLVRRLFLLEGLALALVGAAIGTGLGMLYTKLILYALATIWSEAVAATAVRFYAEGTTLLIGGGGGVLIALVAIWLTLRSQMRRSAVQLLAGSGPSKSVSMGTATRLTKLPFNISGDWIIVGGALLAALLLLVVGSNSQGMAAAGVFFGVGAALLVAMIGLCHRLLASLNQTAGDTRLSLARLGTRHSARRPGRSLATIILMACGTFLVVAVGANRQDPFEAATRKDSGTGGFALFGQTALPLLHDLNTPGGQQALTLDPHQMQGVNILPLRVRQGDDASCLNLSRSQAPTIVGVDAQALADRGAFSFAKTESRWTMLLDELDEPNVIPCIGDEATVVWGLGKSVGDTIAYTDEAGNSFDVRIAATINNSILQGSLMIAQRHFEQRFPSIGGHRILLVDAPSADVQRVEADLTRALGDLGLEMTAAPLRLALFNSVQNTYLSIFQALGGLGLILGSVGLGTVVWRNVLERRSELALLVAVGIARRRVRRLVLIEHLLLVVLGLGSGIVAAVVAVYPAITSSRADVPYLTTATTAALIAASAFGCVVVATTTALRGPLFKALRSE